jgi:hypothetical protein
MGKEELEPFGVALHGFRVSDEGLLNSYFLLKFML